MKHIEDLSPSEFLGVIENLPSYEATEKIDGVNLSFGFDENHKLFVSRESKHTSAKRIFSPDDWPNIGSSNTFRSAHLAILAIEDRVKSILKPNHLVEIEVVFGEQPNAIPYGADGKSFIIFHSALKGTPESVITDLTSQLNDVEVKCVCPVIFSSDGKTIQTRNNEVTFKFLGPIKMDVSKITTNNEFNVLVSKFNEFLLQKSDADTTYTNLELVELKLNTVKKELRDELKLVRSQTTARARREFMIPIKNKLLEILTNHKSILSKPDAVIGVEGVVLKDTKSNEMCKIVDRNKFTALNAFIHTTRRYIGGTVKTTDVEASLEARGGVVGHMKTQIAKLIGEPEMARASQMRRIMDTYNEDDNPVNTIKSFANVHRPDDFQGFKRKTLAIIKQAVNDLDVLLQKYNQQKDSYKLKLSNDIEIGYSQEIHNRTLLSFAESYTELYGLAEVINKANNFEVCVAHLYRRAVRQEQPNMVEPKPVSESTQILTETRYDTDVKRYKNKDAWVLLNTYFATVFLSAMMYKGNDRVGLRMLKDKTNFRLEHWSKEMSPLNFWGYPIWRCNSAAVKKHIGNKTSKELYKVVKRVPLSWFRFLHMDFSFGRDVPINWVDHFKTLKVLQQFPGMNTERVNVIMKGVFGFENLTFDQKVKVMNQLYYYVNAFIPFSPLMIRFKLIYSDIISNKEEHMLITDILPEALLKETADAGMVTSSAAAVFPKANIFGRRVIKRKRNTGLNKPVKFKKPEDCPVK